MNRKTSRLALNSSPSATPRLFRDAIKMASIELSEHLPAHWQVTYESHDGCIADLVLVAQPGSAVPASKTSYSLDARFSPTPEGTSVYTTFTSQSENDYLFEQIFDRTQLVITTALS